VLFRKYTFLNRRKTKVKNIFVTDSKRVTLQAFCKKNRIELVEINDVIDELISELKKKYRGYKIGKETGIARFVLHLVQNDYLE